MGGQPGAVSAVIRVAQHLLGSHRNSKRNTMATLSENVSNAGKLIRQAIGSAMSSVHAGDEKIASHKLDAPRQLSITSTTFTDGGAIPTRNTPQGDNLSPALSWSGVPSGARELLLIVEDPDAPMLKPFVHWILHRIPASITSLPAGLPNYRELNLLSGAVQGQNDAKTIGWYGPKPPLGHGIHHYHFQLFAVDTQLSLGPDATIEDLKHALQGHVLADGEIIGTYERTADSD
jgi:Raf kinase inhibitor-like YbhB/YbcL family protein